MSHTPGPWKVDLNYTPRVIAHDDRATIVCEVTGSVSNESAVADARLIAAAPDLLAACKVALKSLAIGASPLERANAIRDLRLAIAKVEA